MDRTQRITSASSVDHATADEVTEREWLRVIGVVFRIAVRDPAVVSIAQSPSPYRPRKPCTALRGFKEWSTHPPPSFALKGTQRCHQRDMGTTSGGRGGRNLKVPPSGTPSFPSA